MRLGQLARKLALRPVEIVDFLARQSIQIDSGNNSRIEDEHVLLILQKYAPGQLIENVEKEIAEEEKAPEVPTLGNIVTDVPAIQSIAEEKTITEEEKIEVIKAPKIELSGLKVLGKIELPETRKKEPVANTEEPNDQPPTERERRERTNQSQQRPAKNPIALQREREAREEEAKRREQIERDKEKRTLHYLKKVNVAQPTRPVKIQEEKIERKQVTKEPAPTTLWGRFRRWLNS